MNPLRRVVISGMGTVNPLGNTVSEFRDSIGAGRSGAAPITRFDADSLTTRYAAEVKGFDASGRIHRRIARKMDLFSIYAVHAALEAWEDAGLASAPDEPERNALDPDRTGVIFGVGFGGTGRIESSTLSMNARGPSRIDSLLIAKALPNLAPANIAMMLGARGPVYAVATACAGATDAIGQACHMIRAGGADLVVAGGAEGSITALTIAGFNSLQALSTRWTDDPARASRPFAKDRDGFVLGEGAGALVLESLDSAKRRGARIHAEIVGHAMTNDAHHLTAPDPEGHGLARAMQLCLRDAGATPDDVHYINAHGTSTQLNDLTETRAIKRAFGRRASKIPISSTKSMIGHCIGAAGAIEAIASILAIQDRVIPPTINLDQPDPECDLDYVPHRGRTVQTLDTAMSNSLGFGGHNSSLLIRRYE